MFFWGSRPVRIITIIPYGDIMTGYAITSLHIQNFRAIRDVTLRLDGLTVLIGDNGSGKSTIIEALELLRKAAISPSFVNEVISRQHGGFHSLVRQGADEFRLGVRLESTAGCPPMEYAFSIGQEGDYAMVAGEWLRSFGAPDSSEPLNLIVRDRTSWKTDTKSRLNGWEISPTELVLTSFGKQAPDSTQRVMDALSSIQVHVPFDVRPHWLGLEHPPQSRLRSPIAVERASSLDRFGSNITNCFHILKNSLSDSEWKALLQRTRLGLGEDLEDIMTPPFIRGQIELQVKFRSLREPIPASLLSDGQLSFLSFIALMAMAKGKGLIAFDEPESHLHPALIARVVWMFEELSRHQPVILCTHSDRLLDMLSDPAKSVVLCELDDQRHTVLKRPNKESLEDWLKHYRGIGDLLAEGYDAQVFDEPEGEVGR